MRIIARAGVNHALIRNLTPVLRPLFRSNHTWAMRRGERQLREYLTSPDERAAVGG